MQLTFDSVSISFVMAFYMTVGVCLCLYVLKDKVMIELVEQWDAASDEHGYSCNDHFINCIFSQEALYSVSAVDV